MSTPHRESHWQNVYRTKDECAVSWFQESPEVSLDLIRATGLQTDASVIDIGGGSSRLVDALLDAGYTSVTVLDISEKALETSRVRLGTRNAGVEWIVADVTNWLPSQTFNVWHDRAAFHFLTDPNDQSAYAKRVHRAVDAGGYVIIGTFAPDGPERCSGLPVERHDALSLGKILGDSFDLVETRRHDHRTPSGTIQEFQFNLFHRKP